MRKVSLFLVLALATVLASGCMRSGQTVDFKAVAAEAKMVNVTTGDGHFDSYQAVGHYSSWELGLGLGLPGMCFKELYPNKSNNDQVMDIAVLAAGDGANAMIEVKVPETQFLGFIFGIYIDKTNGTGIKTK